MVASALISPLLLLDRLLEDGDARATAWSEFEQRRDAAPIPPLCDYDAPIGFAWPEYVTTPRGRDWHIPS